MTRVTLPFLATGRNRPVLEDADEIDRLYHRARLSILVSIMLGYGFLYTCRLGMAVVKKPLIDERIFTADDLGKVGSAIFYGYAFGRLVNGFLADHANLRKFFTLGVLLSALVNLCIGSTTLLWVWIVLWGLNGWFQGFGAPSSIVSIAHWFSRGERGRVYGIWSTSHSIGEGLTFVGTAALVSAWGWRAGFVGPGIFCLFVAVGIYAFMRDRPQTMGLPNVADWKNDRPPDTDTATSVPDAGRSQLEILKLPGLWILCLASATMYITRYGVNSWGTLYLQEARGYSLLQAGSIMGLNTIAGIAGCVAYGFISDNLFRARRPPVTLLFGLVEVASLLVIFLTPPGHPLILTAAFTVYGFTLSGLLAVLGGLFAVDIVPRHAAGAAIGMTGVFSYLAAALQERISGWLIHHGDKVETIRDAAGNVVREVHHYDFSKPIAFWVGSSVLSLVLAASLWRVRVQE